ncbi:helix-turn-helix domain-containing protein [Sulfuriroseicoccus oceanibius]|uniref:Uncharacterized protein n=1 Tax=Sulfuriroseicoccus oceanibius TaxID=2707525 RepID=A0A6B3LA24_9BACT|nr:helix-turn-helix domain-containing protein [Sulfuriroseicoccus oceanibius]QQL44231.1 hypothetical protein G3M56_010030 [Sulfuriroseicoccus oceanibius]
MKQEILTRPELAARLRVSTKTVTEWTIKGLIPCLKADRATRYDWREVQDALSTRNKAK